MKPTRQQIDNARMYFERLLCLGVFATEDKEHLRTLLAATEPATDLELVIEANAAATRAQAMRRPHRTFGQGYLAGARREGRDR